MKLNKFVVALGLGMTLVSGMANAAGQGSGQVTFKGSIIDAPCSIAAESVDQTVEMGQIANVALKNSGKSTEVPFTIKLTGCDLTGTPAKTKVNATFTGPTGTVTDSFAIAGTAAGASLLLRDTAGVVVANGKASSDVLLPAAGGDAELKFAAYLQGNGASATVTPGDFTTVTTFALSYQ
ncbi:hypothetical protein A9993_12255 [Rahnella victoriana]|uniref:fimbrial protein n=1 Tax=Rahnella victoriana TaxID=1510570 RepID=UPI000BB1759A|nr:fimbrial protein [Rahnella victoriana]PBI80453.1 hypothetical protein A9993_12255 [Rahnella victoriana]